MMALEAGASAIEAVVGQEKKLGTDDAVTGEDDFKEEKKSLFRFFKSKKKLEKERHKR